ncbi:MAG: hypothetical protein H0W16_00855 [Actinobacteria bacterium]|nr:hypothetical protein [Actinomycetota bacterium]
MKRILSSKVLLNVAVLCAGALLVVGVAAYISSRPEPSPATNTETYGRDFELPETTQAFTAADLPKGVRKTAGEFILAAAGREDLAKAWKLTHPELRAQCGCTYKQWLKGDIPVQYYPSEDISTASFEVSEITPREIYLRVLLLPKETSEVKPQVFDIGLKSLGSGPKKQWLVTYWAAKVAIQVPATPDG